MNSRFTFTFVDDSASVSMCCERFFGGQSGGFMLVFWGLIWFLFVFWVLFDVCLYVV